MLETLRYSEKNLSGSVCFKVLNYRQRLDFVRQTQEIAEKDGNLAAAEFIDKKAEERIEKVDLKINKNQVSSYEDIGFFEIGAKVYADIREILQNGIKSPNDETPAK